MDKRVLANERVKSQIEAALFTLMTEKHFSEITVSDIIRTAGVARASYYRNFDSKEEVIEKYMENQRRDVASLITFSNSVTDIFNEEKLVEALQHYLEQKDRLLLLYDNGFGTFLQEDMNRFAELTLGDIPQRSVKRYALYFLAGAMFNTTIQWLKSGARESPRTMARAFIKMLSQDFGELDGLDD